MVATRRVRPVSTISIPKRSVACDVAPAAHPSPPPDQRIEIAGGHVHRRANPAGDEFEIGCFIDAPGVAVHGEPTAEYSWFAGYLWSFALCRRCDSQLGWFFDGTEPNFYGLILVQLVEETGKPS